MSKSLFEFIAEAIDEAMPPDSGMTGREIYLLGFERYQRYHSERRLAEDRRAFDKNYPLLAGKDR